MAGYLPKDSALPGQVWENTGGVRAAVLTVVSGTVTLKEKGVKRDSVYTIDVVSLLAGWRCVADLSAPEPAPVPMVARTMNEAVVELAAARERQWAAINNLRATSLAYHDAGKELADSTKAVNQLMESIVTHLQETTRPDGEDPGIVDSIQLAVAQTAPEQAEAKIVKAQDQMRRAQ